MDIAIEQILCLVIMTNSKNVRLRIRFHCFDHFLNLITQRISCTVPRMPKFKSAIRSKMHDCTISTKIMKIRSCSINCFTDVHANLLIQSSIMITSNEVSCNTFSHWIVLYNIVQLAIRRVRIKLVLMPHSHFNSVSNITSMVNVCNTFNLANIIEVMQVCQLRILRAHLSIANDCKFQSTIAIPLAIMKLRFLILKCYSFFFSMGLFFNSFVFFHTFYITLFHFFFRVVFFPEILIAIQIGCYSIICRTNTLRMFVVMAKIIINLRLTQTVFSHFNSNIMPVFNFHLLFSFFS